MREREGEDQKQKERGSDEREERPWPFVIGVVRKVISFHWRWEFQGVWIARFWVGKFLSAKKKEKKRLVGAVVSV